MDEVRMLERTDKVRDVPLEIRRGFIKKVYGILFFMLLVSFGISFPFIYLQDKPKTGDNKALEFMNQHIYLLVIVMVLLLVQQMFNMCMMFQMCCGGSSLIRCYLRMFMTVPWNYIFLTTYAVCFGVVIGFITTQYQVSSVILAFGLSVAMMVALTIYAACTKTDFTGFGMYIFAAFFGLFMLAVMAGLTSFLLCTAGASNCLATSEFLYRAIAVLGAVLFSFVIIYDTQLIFGTASMEFGRSNCRQLQFTIDMYAFAAYQLYLDFVNLFLYLLEIFGRRR